MNLSSCLAFAGYLKVIWIRELRRLSLMSPCKIAIVQLASTNNISQNLNTIVGLITDAAEKGAKMVFLPESADFIGTSNKETLALAENFDGHFFTGVMELSKKLDIWISIGSMHRKPDPKSQDQRLLNSHVVLNNRGKVIGTYDKTHLFSINFDAESLPDQIGSKHSFLQESRFIQPGITAPVVINKTPVGDLGLGICYDMRFPELASALRYKCGANVLAYPSAFTSVTGEAGHWHTLLRARAIENQCYVVAAAQNAVHNPKFTTYGHSLVVDPFGRIIAEQTKSGPGLLFAEIHHTRSGDFAGNADINYTDRVRAVLPVESSRRHDLFPLPDAGMPVSIGTDDFRFGPIVLQASQVFYRTHVSMAFVNISPLVDGHVLVTPIDVVERFASLRDGTISDMYACIRRISGKLCEHYGAQSLTISTQDGKDAGQSVPHVHVHVLPRKPGDFARNDDIYDALQKHDKVTNRKFRTQEEMAEEARLLRSFFYDTDGRPLKQSEC